MELLVCIKQVPDTSEIKLDPETNTLIRTGLPSIVNPFDMNALEAALTVKDKYPGTRVSVITMGPPQASVALKECISMGPMMRTSLRTVPLPVPIRSLPATPSLVLYPKCRKTRANRLI